MQQIYAESRAKVLEDTAALRRKEAFSKSAEAVQKSKAERLMRQLDLQRKEQDRIREAELNSQSSKGKAVLKKLETNAKRAKEEPSGTAEADKKPKAWATFSNFFGKQEENKKAEEAAIAAKEGKRLKVMQELEERKVKAEKAALQAEEEAAKIEALAKTAREDAAKAAEAAQKAASAGEAQEAAARAAREEALRAREAAEKALAAQAGQPAPQQGAAVAPPAPPPRPTTGLGVIQALKELKELKDGGLVNSAEFDRLKAKVLAGQ